MLVSLYNYFLLLVTVFSALCFTILIIAKKNAYVLYRSEMSFMDFCFIDATGV